jgi:hypothetical protein
MSPVISNVILVEKGGDRLKKGSLSLETIEP